MTLLAHLRAKRPYVVFSAEEPGYLGMELNNRPRILLKLRDGMTAEQAIRDYRLRFPHTTIEVRGVTWRI